MPRKCDNAFSDNNYNLVPCQGFYFRCRFVLLNSMNHTYLLTNTKKHIENTAYAASEFDLIIITR